MSRGGTGRFPLASEQGKEEAETLGRRHKGGRGLHKAVQVQRSGWILGTFEGGENWIAAGQRVRERRRDEGPFDPPSLFSPVHLKVRSGWWPYGTQPGSCRAHTDSPHLGRLWEDS